MKQIVVFSIFLIAIVAQVFTFQFCNDSMAPDAVSQQLVDFRRRHPRPVGVLTKITGRPLDIRDTVTLNTDIFTNINFFRLNSHQDRERIPERLVHAKGVGGFGYFEVTNDVSKYTKADVFNGIGKRTPLVVRFSTARQNRGGSDIDRDAKALVVKMYTEEGNLDFITFNIPVFVYRDPIDFRSFIRAFRRNPRTQVFDNTMQWDFLTLKPESLHANLWLMSDLGLPDGFRKANYFPFHTYEIYNKEGKRYFVKFNFRTEIGLFNLTNTQGSVLRSEDPDYYNRDLYNAIANKNYPAWRLEMDILTKEDLTRVDFDPFDMIRLWKRGSYHTVTIGRLVLNKNVDNHFKDTEKTGFNPDNLVPGIAGPHDAMFRARKLFYLDAQNYRLGANAANTPINAPLYKKTYSRDGVAPVLDNMKDAPNYYPNSFNGPVPYVDESRPKDLPIILQTTAIDLQPLAEFYNEILESDSHRQRVAENVANTMLNIPHDLEKRALLLLTQVDMDLGSRVSAALEALKMVSQTERLDQITQCFANADREKY
ncbi:unnamed protein product [Arctia plantaginis]|uniref:Catalase core domain-containing protein n=1 Tax=Arctia plantaginis TaxID=874455 RepID=A0A8S1B9N5_ARCPL|nr:unnamed protein product [Arctia plantaginis]